MESLPTDTPVLEEAHIPGIPWVQRTPYTKTREVLQDGKRRLQVRSLREGAPFSPGHTSLLFLKRSHIKEAPLCFGTILDVDPKKSKTGARQITGGMLKNHGPDTEPESFIDGAREEALAETGFLASIEDIYPAARVIKSRFPGRNLQTDTSSGEKTTVTQNVFARFGEAEFIETDDSDAKDPRWDIASSSVFESGEFFKSHSIIVPAVLALILKNIEPYEQGLITDPHDLRFFDRLMCAEEAQKGAREAFDVAEYRRSLKEFRDSLDLSKICLKLSWGNHKKAEEYLSRLRFFPLGSGEYFES